MKRCFVVLGIILLFVNGLVLAGNPKLCIRYEDNAQFELIAPDGARVLIDVYNKSFYPLRRQPGIFF